MTREESAELRAWEAEHGPRIKALARRLLMDEGAAEEVLQDSLLAAWEARGSFEGRSSVGTWLYRIALNRALRERERLERGRALAVELAKAEGLPGGAGAAGRGAQAPRLEAFREAGLGEPERELAEKEIAAEIRERCFWYYTFLLSPAQRSAFILREVLDLDYAAVAEILEVSVGVVKSRLKRARDRLASHFRSRCSWVDPANPCRCEGRLPYVLAKYPAVLEKYRRRLGPEEIAARLALVEEKARSRLPPSRRP